jgi:reverse gyrase
MEWDLLKKLIELNNSGKKKEVNEFILETDFKDMQRLKDAAISCFSLTIENVSNNIEAAKKLIGFEYDGFRENLRAAHALAILEELEKEKN